MSVFNRLTYLNKNFPITRVALFLLSALIINGCAVKEYKVSHHQVVGVEGEMGANMMHCMTQTQGVNTAPMVVDQMKDMPPNHGRQTGYFDCVEKEIYKNESD